MSGVIRKLAFCICKKQRRRLAQITHIAYQRLSFCYIGNTISVLPKSLISSRFVSKTGFLATRLIYFSDTKLEQNQVAGFLTLLRNMIQTRPTNQDSFVRTNGAAIIGALLQKVISREMYFMIVPVSIKFCQFPGQHVPCKIIKKITIRMCVRDSISEEDCTYFVFLLPNFKINLVKIAGRNQQNDIVVARQ